MRQIDQSIMYPLPTEALLQEREVAWKVRLPDDYKNFIMRKNGFRPSKNLFSLANRSFLIERFLCVLENTKDNPIGIYDIDVVMSQLDERLFVHEDILGFELVPIASLLGGDFLCLNYLEEAAHPSMCIWYHEESYELDPAIEFVANNFTEFLAMLQD
ncbi:SMI1/KNR4 family protein [Streptococcus gordonii]|uniref:SMI1/KNR4 family protein n=1 Tax=Streptococcus gordonii TaxID=1302 RepID=UPI001C8CA3A2|nr:SMI1/KNR4 family protein [Streptococcus gordonii]MBX9098079.1 SMI1/KNR4 family protein [Streptococcus gordonii]